MALQAFRSARPSSWKWHLRCSRSPCQLERTHRQTCIKEKRKMETSSIAGKVVVITGASSGIGESTAKRLARRGAKVVLGARRKDRIDALVKQISAEDGKAIAFAVDVTKRAEVEALIKGAVDTFGRVDVIVN